MIQILILRSHSLFFKMNSAIIIFSLIVGVTFGASGIEKVNAPHPAYQKDIELSPAADSKIVNGLPAYRNQFPYQVSLTWAWFGTPSHICGGSIVSDRIVVTAAHCIYDYGTYTLIAGILNRGESTTTTQSRSVASITDHPNWPGGNVVAANDISIMRVTVPFTWSDAVQPVRLPVSGASFSGTAFLSGWGRTSSSSSVLPTTLQFVEKELLTHNQCVSALTGILGSSNPLDETMICTSGASRISACSGDSGGPLVQHGVLIGVVSWGISPCGTVNAPSVFTRTASFYNWIANNM